MTGDNWWLGVPGLYYWGIPALAGLVILLGLAVWLWRTRTRRRIRRTVKTVSHDHLTDVVVPDGMDGWIHIEWLLLTSGGLVVLDIRDVPGTIFGADRMEEWAVMNDSRRYGMRNPLYPMRDRVAALRDLAPDVPVRGICVFTERGRFSHGMPEDTVMLGELVDNLGEIRGGYPEAFDALWRDLKQRSHAA